MVEVDEAHFNNIMSLVERVIAEAVRRSSELQQNYDILRRMHDDPIVEITEDLAYEWGVDKFSHIKKIDNDFRDEVLRLFDDLVEGKSDESSHDGNLV